MRRHLLVVPALLSLAAALSACTGVGGGAAAAVPLRAVGSASGDATGPQVFLAGVPMNALVKVHGDVKYTVQPVPPFVTLDGDYTVIVEPLPGREAEAQRAIESGDLLIRREGKPSNLNAPGSVRAWKAIRESQRVYVPAARPAPPPPPAPTPQPTGRLPTVCDPNDPACQAPDLRTQ